LIAADPSLVHSRGGDGQTPLHFAATGEIAAYLLEQGADLDARDIDHESTPAQWMVRDRPEVARYLVRRGCRTDILMAAALGELALVREHLEADPGCIRMTVSEQYFPKGDPRSAGTIYNWTLDSDKTAHVIAREFGHEKVLAFLMERTPEELKLALACELGDEALRDELLARRPQLVQQLSEEEQRKLPNAARDNNTKAVRMMLAAGWPVDALGQHHGETALHWAAFHGNATMVKEILPYGPNLEPRSREYDGTALHWGVYGSVHGWHPERGDYAAAVEALLQAGASAPMLSEDLQASDAVRAVLRRRIVDR
ncbi:MAG TPA: ankyrin repeat domain-containing protein, partial [Gemmatimonadales bacterium]|nr:ankyrin repeat domain-containing protein [Gemmatimonadales bacterium]